MQNGSQHELFCVQLGSVNSNNAERGYPEEGQYPAGYALQEHLTAASTTQEVSF